MSSIRKRSRSRIWQKLLMYILDSICEGELRLDQMRSSFVSRCDDIRILFERLDCKSRDYLTLDDFARFFREHNKRIANLDQIRLFCRYDIGSKGRISFNDFTTVLRSQPSRHSLETPMTPEESLIALFQEEIDFETHICHLCQILLKMSRYSHIRSFKALDYDKDHALSYSDVNRFFKRHGDNKTRNKLTQAEYARIARFFCRSYMTQDERETRTLSLWDWSDGLSPYKSCSVDEFKPSRAIVKSTKAPSITSSEAMSSATSPEPVEFNMPPSPTRSASVVDETREEKFDPISFSLSGSEHRCQSLKQSVNSAFSDLNWTLDSVVLPSKRGDRLPFSPQDSETTSMSAFDKVPPYFEDNTMLDLDKTGELVFDPVVRPGNPPPVSPAPTTQSAIISPFPSKVTTPVIQRKRRHSSEIGTTTVKSATTFAMPHHSRCQCLECLNNSQQNVSNVFSVHNHHLSTVYSQPSLIVSPTDIHGTPAILIALPQVMPTHTSMSVPPAQSPPTPSTGEAHIDRPIIHMQTSLCSILQDTPPAPSDMSTIQSFELSARSVREGSLPRMDMLSMRDLSTPAERLRRQKAQKSDVFRGNKSAFSPMTDRSMDRHIGFASIMNESPLRPRNVLNDIDRAQNSSPILDDRNMDGDCIFTLTELHDDNNKQSAKIIPPKTSESSSPNTFSFNADTRRDEAQSEQGSLFSLSCGPHWGSTFEFEPSVHQPLDTLHEGLERSTTTSNEQKSLSPPNTTTSLPESNEAMGQTDQGDHEKSGEQHKALLSLTPLSQIANAPSDPEALARVMSTQIAVEKYHEKLFEKLHNDCRFDIRAAFAALKGDCNVVTVETLKHFFERHDINLPHSGVELLMRRLCTTSDTKEITSVHTFANAMLPVSLSACRAFLFSTSAERMHELKQGWTQTIDIRFAGILYDVVGAEKIANDLRVAFRDRGHLSLVQAFGWIDISTRGRIFGKQLARFLEYYGVTLADRDILYLFRRYDRSNYGRVFEQERHTMSEMENYSFQHLGKKLRIPYSQFANELCVSTFC